MHSVYSCVIGFYDVHEPIMIIVHVYIAAGA